MMRLSMLPLPRISKLKVKNLFEIPMVFGPKLVFYAKHKLGTWNGYEASPDELHKMPV